MAAAAVLLLCPGASLAQQTNIAPQGVGFQSGAASGEAAAGAPQAEAPETNSSPNVLQAAGADQPLQSEGPSGMERGPLVVVGRDAELKADETAEVVVVIGGSAKVHGKVREGVVVIGGDLEVDGDVGNTVVVVLGDVKAKPGANLHQDVVAVMGSIKVEPKAKIHGDAVAVAGRLDVAGRGSVMGAKQEIGVNLEWLRKWVVHCLFKLRPLAPQVGWVWVVAGAFFLFYLLVATAFPRPVRACVDVLNDRPATTVVLGILAKLLVPIVCLILAVTGIGLLVLPFVGLAAFIGVIIGKVALLEWVGLRIGQQTGVRLLQKPLAAFVLGALILTLFYMVWVIGLLAYIWFSIWGLGVAVTAVLDSLRRRRMQVRAAAPPPVRAAAAMGAAGPGGMTGTGEGSGAQPGPAPEPPTLTQPRRPAVAPEALSCPRAGFWERMGAGFLDVVLLGVAGSLGGLGMHWIFLAALAYFAGLWTWKGTTVGGTVLGLKVVRLDGQPLTFMVALVRALAAGFSMIVLFLGFLWIAWDPEKQGWHDRIAGTVVFRLPRGTPLVCC
jgi:uncharacterized RDD family membrane protein YckC/cytoskeletal protein CcmA (bactofilin family)